jgi:hypothetical protein
MNVRHATILLGLLATAIARAQATDREENLWPVRVTHAGPAGTDFWSGAGPFLFWKPNADIYGNTAFGFRPFWLRVNTREGDFRGAYFLYPLFSYTTDDTNYKWSVFELIRFWDRRKSAGAPTSIYDQRQEFEVFPFWFHRDSPDPERSHRGLFPIYGNVKNKYSYARFSWALFPLYFESEKRGSITTYTPWPIIRRTHGAAHGWGVWPLFNYVDRPGVSRHETYLWPLGFNATWFPDPDEPTGTPPRRAIGALPFYARSTGPGFISEDFLWPFFGYYNGTQPVAYKERRYFWPLMVQGRGENKYVNRFAPFYTHSIKKGYDKRWYLWPLVRHAKWTDANVERTRTQFLWWFYWNEDQRPAGRPNDPAAKLTHVWPLFSNWDDGRGRKQWQVFSPFDVFLARNQVVRQIWTPFASIVRHEQRAPGDERTSLFWNAITWERQTAQERSEWHVGPLLGVTREGGEQRVAIGNGLLSFRRAAGSGWRMLWLDFPGKSATNTSAR